jgi:hypothetical protein
LSLLKLVADTKGRGETWRPPLFELHETINWTRLQDAVHAQLSSERQ